MFQDRFPEPSYVSDPAFEDTFTSAQQYAINALNEARLFLKCARKAVAASERGWLDDAWENILGDALRDAFPNDHKLALEYFKEEFEGIE